MNKLKLMTSVFAASTLFAGSVQAQSAVQVEVVQEGEDAFFAPPAPEPVAEPAPPAAPTPRPDSPKGRAEALFEQLEREEAGLGSTPPGPRAPAAPPVTPAAPPVTPEVPVATAPSAPNVSNPPPPSAGQVAPSSDSAQQVQGQAKRSWWDRPSHLSKGDLSVWVSGGSFDAGGFGGLGGEAMASDTIGIRLSGWLGTFGHQAPGSGMSSNWNFFEGGVWAVQRDVNPSTAKGGVAHLTELSVAVHLLPKQMFDLYTTLGLSHFGYEVDYREGTERGGAAYTRLGAGANVHFSRFFVGADFGWYPVELFRYDLNEVRRDDYEADLASVNNRFEAKRYTLTAQVGLRF